MGIQSWYSITKQNGKALNVLPYRRFYCRSNQMVTSVLNAKAFHIFGSFGLSSFSLPCSQIYSSTIFLHHSFNDCNIWSWTIPFPRAQGHIHQLAWPFPLRQHKESKPARAPNITLQKATIHTLNKSYKVFPPKWSSLHPFNKHQQMMFTPPIQQTPTTCALSLKIRYRLDTHHTWIADLLLLRT